MPWQAHAQTDESAYSIAFHGAPLELALETVAELTGIDLAFSSDLVEGEQIYCKATNESVEEILRCLLKTTTLDYIRSSDGTYIIIRGNRHPARLGQLAGMVIDADSGLPLPYANILLADAAVGASADSEGMFALNALLEGPQRLLVTYVGYEMAEESVTITPGSQKRIQIALAPRDVALAPILINGIEQRIPSVGLGQIEQNEAQLEQVAGQGYYDVMRGAARMTGVSSLQPLADLQVQGSAAGDHLTLLDGVPVRDPVSLGRYLGAFSPLAIERLRLHKAGFGVEHGSHLTGVVSVEQRRRTNPGRLAALSIDPVSTNGRFQVAVPTKQTLPASIMAAYRASNWGIYEDRGVLDLLQAWTELDPFHGSLWLNEAASESSLSIVGQHPEVSFSDAHLSIDIPMRNFQRLSGMLYRATNRLSSSLTAVNVDPTYDDDKVLLTGDSYDWTNWAGRLGHAWLWGDRTTVSVQGRGSWHTSRVIYQSLQDNVVSGFAQDAGAEAFRQYENALVDHRSGDEEHGIREYGLDVEIDHSLNPGNVLHLGFQVAHTDGRVNLRTPTISGFNYAMKTTDVAAYFQPTFSIGPQLTFEPGLRATYVPAHKTMFFEPRMALRYDHAEGRFAARLAGGLYYQFVNQFDVTSFSVTSVVPWILFWLPVDESLNPPKALHLASEFLWMPSETITFKAEGYIKDQQRLLMLDYRKLPGNQLAALGGFNQASFITETEGFVAGASAQLTYEIPSLSATVAYARTRS